LFLHPWPSRLATIGHLVCCPLFLLRTLVTRRLILVRALGPNLAQGELLLTATAVRAKVLACFRAGQRFLVVRSAVPDPVGRACTRLGVDVCEDLRVYMSLNALIVFFANAEGSPVVVHLATSSAGKEALERHRRGLKIVREMLPVCDLIPETIASASGQLMQSRLPGGSARPEVHTAIELALDALLRLQVPAQSEGDHDLIFQQFPLLTGRWPELQTSVIPLLARLQSWQRRRQLPGVLTHGDYWLGNVLFVGNTVTGIVDWERARACGIPGLDALHLALMSLAMDSRRDILSYLGQLWTRQFETRFLADYVTHLKAAYGLTDDDTAHLGAFLYLDELHKLNSAGRDISAEKLPHFLAVALAIAAWTALFPDTSEAGTPIAVTQGKTSWLGS
jgi:Phosphotransferase enzyme family